MSQVRLLCAENGQISIVGQAHSLCCNGAAQSTILLLILTMVNPYSGNSALASVSDHHFGLFTAPSLGLLDLDNFLVFCADEFIPLVLGAASVCTGDRGNIWKLETFKPAGELDMQIVQVLFPALLAFCRILLCPIITCMIISYAPVLLLNNTVTSLLQKTAAKAKAKTESEGHH